MNKGGRPRTPTKILELRGSKRAKYDRSKDKEPRPEPEAPDCPAYLTGEARALWLRVVPELEQMKILAKIDREMLAAMCNAWADYLRLRKKVKGKEILTTGKGYQYHNPAVAIMNTALDKYHRLAREFGFSPSSRSAIQIEPDTSSKKKDSKKLEYLKRVKERATS